MEWISQWLDKILQGMFWRSLIHQFQWIDWLALVLITAGIIYGIKKGFIGVLGDTLQILIMTAVVLEFDHRAGALLALHLGIIPAAYGPLAGFTAMTLLTWFFIHYLAKYVSKFITAQTSAALRILGGAVAGGFYFFLLLSFFSQALLLSPWSAVKGVYEKKASVTGFTLSRTAPKIHRLVTRPLNSVTPGV